ncbi:MAG: alpha-glucan family phosphorylase [Acidimicrobiales bacterium]
MVNCTVWSLRADAALWSSLLYRFARMQAQATFTVRPRLPEALAALRELALNLRWSWDASAQDLFATIDPETWAAVGRDPVALLAAVPPERLGALAADRGFTAALAGAVDDLHHHLGEELWFQQGEHRLTGVAYFSPEFGIAEALPQYSGGLGVLAGDHLKAASGLGVPLVGVGLFYHQGYFRQELAPDGWQQQRYVTLDPESLALERFDGERVQVGLAGRLLSARMWRAQVGRIPLLLLDTDIDANDADLRSVTDRLYGGDTEHRLQQEILLGVGGVQALGIAGMGPQVFHTNEGHAGFLGLERIRRHVRDDGLSFTEAIEAVRASTVFTTHTPVPAGIDRFARPLMERYFSSCAEELGVSFDTLMAIGQEPGEPPDAPFNMAVMGLRLAGFANGVSLLHGQVSRRIFANLWPAIPEGERPIDFVTNGVHALSWVGPEMSVLYERHLGRDWPEAGPEAWAKVDGIDDGELWAAVAGGRGRLVAFARQRLRSSLRARRVPDHKLDWADGVLDPDALTIGFARRFATYKRATLLLSQPDRLAALLLAADRPVQLVFAGKAHPDDDQGKEMIRRVVQFSTQHAVRHRMVFLEDYDIGVARVLYQGADLWLNTPRRPLEACGTSGEKAALNGALNCSVRDGWWDECYDGVNGWAMDSAEDDDDLDRRDRSEAASLFDLLENHVVPAFYDRGADGVPRRWLVHVRASLRTLGPFVPASRMVRDYVTGMYEPAAARRLALEADGQARTRALAAWKAKVRQGWASVRVTLVDPAAPVDAQAGGSHTVAAAAVLGDLSATDVEVQLLHGPVDAAGNLVDPTVVPMVARSSVEGAERRFETTFTYARTGRYGWTVRVVPTHPDLRTWAELGCVTWA